MSRKFLMLILIFALPACVAAPVKMQTIPVSTDPPGASVLIDGKSASQSPCTIDLARTKDHIVTLRKEGFQQQDVIIKRRYQQEKVLINAINQGINSGSFFGNAAMGLNSGVQSMNSQEATGDAYVLDPSTISIRLMPKNGFPKTTSAGEAQAAMAADASPLSMMQQADEQMLESALESIAAGQTKTWTNSTTQIHFAVIPELATQSGGMVVREFNIAAKQGQYQTTRMYKGIRVGNGEWQIGEPPQQKETIDNKAMTKGILRTLGNATGPIYKKEKNIHKSTKTSITHNSDGSITQKSRSTSVSAGISVSPGAVFSLIDALEGMGTKK